MKVLIKEKYMPTNEFNELKKFAKENNLNLETFHKALKGLGDLSELVIQKIENDTKDLDESDKVPEIARKYLLEIINSTTFDMSMFRYFFEAVKKIHSNNVNIIAEFEKELK